MHQFILTLGNLQGHVLLDEASRCGQLKIINNLLSQRKQCRGSYYVLHPILAVLHVFAKPADYIILRVNLKH